MKRCEQKNEKTKNNLNNLSQTKDDVANAIISVKAEEDYNLHCKWKLKSILLPNFYFFFLTWKDLLPLG